MKRVSLVALKNRGNKELNDSHSLLEGHETDFCSHPQNQEPEVNFVEKFLLVGLHYALLHTFGNDDFLILFLVSFKRLLVHCLKQLLC